MTDEAQEAYNNELVFSVIYFPYRSLLTITIYPATQSWCRKTSIRCGGNATKK